MNNMKRTMDGRFIDTRIKFKPNLQKKLIEKCKNMNNLTWRKFAEILNVSEHVLRHQWRNEINTLPLSIVKKIAEMTQDLDFEEIDSMIDSRLNTFWGRQTKEKDVVIPNVNSVDFAEFVGILLGDGCIYSDYTGFCISCHKILDYEYVINYISPLIMRLFNAQPAIYISNKQQSIRCTFYSKRIGRFLKDFGLPLGKKKLQVTKIPSIFFDNKKLLAACIRGLVDTDGSFCPHPHSHIFLDLTIKLPTLWISSVEAFERLRLLSTKSKNKIYLYGKKKLINYFRKIGSSNIKHIIKFDEFIRNKKVPLTSEMEEMIKNISNKKFDLPYYFKGPWSIG